MHDLIKNLIESPTVIEGDRYRSKTDLDTAIFSVIYVWSQLRSKDPNTKVGSAVYEQTTGAMHFGYNGFNVGVPDDVRIWNNRDINADHNKYQFIVHSEVNSIIKALRAGFNPAESVLYITHFPCHHCVKDVIIPSGIKVIKYLDEYPPDKVTHDLLDKTDIKLINIQPWILQKMMK